jgi:hypothetical protein
MSNLAKGVLITLAVVLIGLIYLYLAMVGPLQNLNLGLGLAAGLSQNILVWGYSMANLVLFLIFLVIIVLCGAILLATAKKKPEVEG